MHNNKVVSLAAYKAQLFSQQTGQKVVEPALPEPTRLWELLDKNICLSVWKKGR